MYGRQLLLTTLFIKTSRFVRLYKNFVMFGIREKSFSYNCAGVQHQIKYVISSFDSLIWSNSGEVKFLGLVVRSINC